MPAFISLRPVAILMFIGIVHGPGIEPALAAGASAPLKLVPPVTPACISSPFGPRILPHRPLAGTFHPGIDLPAPEGAPVHAITTGTVIRVQRRGPGGLEMLVQHPGFIGVYSHLGHVAPAIAEGQRLLSSGEVIGVVGRTGVTYGMHLYFGMIVNGRAIDPAPYLSLSGCDTKSARNGSIETLRPPSRSLSEKTRLATK